MRRSIRSALLTWYTLILMAVIGSFGTTLVISQRRSMIRQMEEALSAHATALASAVEDDETGDGFELEMSREYFDEFDQEGGDGPYFIIWRRGGEMSPVPRPDFPVPHPEEEGTRIRDGHIEVSRPGRDGTWVLVGQTTLPVKEAMAAFAWKVGVTGAVVLLVSLLGGWILAGRVLGPIHRISEAAKEISEENLAHRIDLRKTENELGSLATVLNEAFDRLQGAIERQRRFTADASHELRTPLSVILVTAEHAVSRERDPEQYREALETIDRAAKRMKSLIAVLLSMARADSGDASIARESIDLEKVVEETFDLIGPLARERGVELKRETGPAEILGHGDLILEMATNLVSNAILHNRRGGQVRVAVGMENGSVLCEIEDDGPGIPEEDLPHVFERFYRVDKARSRRTGGSGLGLAITKWIVEEHGGSISVRSEPGKGSVFSVRLPLPAP